MVSASRARSEPSEAVMMVRAWLSRDFPTSRQAAGPMLVCEVRRFNVLSFEFRPGDFYNRQAVGVIRYLGGRPMPCWRKRVEVELEHPARVIPFQSLYTAVTN